MTAATTPYGCVHESDSAEALKSFPDASFDWIYVDAQHTYEGVKRDIAAAWTKVKSDGFLVFNDYTMWSHIEMRDAPFERGIFPHFTRAWLNVLSTRCNSCGLATPENLAGEIAVKRAV